MQPPPLSYPILEQQNCQILHFKTDGSGWSKAEGKGRVGKQILFSCQKGLSLSLKLHVMEVMRGGRERQPLQV